MRLQVKFDVTNAEHRKYLGGFMQNQSWSHCPYSFHIMHPQEDVNTLAIMQRELLKWYTENEFHEQKSMVE